MKENLAADWNAAEAERLRTLLHAQLAEVERLRALLFEAKGKVPSSYGDLHRRMGAATKARDRTPANVKRLLGEGISTWTGWPPA